MTHFHFDKAFRILAQTVPFVLLRLAVYTLAVAATALWFGGMFLLFRDWPFPGPPWLAFVFGGVLWGTAAKLVRNYVLYLVKAAHVAVITRLAVSGGLPEGTRQLSYGKDLVLSRFLEVSVLFAVDRLVHLILRTFNRTVFGLFSFIPGSKGLRNLAQRVLDYSAGYVDEAILSYALLHPEQNPWSSAKDGLILYVQNWRTILGSGVVLALLSYGVVAVVAAPGALVAWSLAGPARQIVMAASVGLGLIVKFAFMDPFALTSVIVNYHAAIAGQRPSPEWDRKLGEISGKFQDMKNLAANWRPGSAPPPAPAGPVNLG